MGGNPLITKQQQLKLGTIVYPWDKYVNKIGPDSLMGFYSGLSRGSSFCSQKYSKLLISTLLESLSFLSCASSVLNLLIEHGVATYIQIKNR